jgi:hypothetical protein
MWWLSGLRDGAATGIGRIIAFDAPQNLTGLVDWLRAAASKPVRFRRSQEVNAIVVGDYATLNHSGVAMLFGGINISSSPIVSYPTVG